jgi:hypothetical protein
VNLGAAHPPAPPGNKNENTMCSALSGSVPGFMHTLLRVIGVLSDLKLIVVLGFGFSWRPPAKAVHEPAGVVPGHQAEVMFSRVGQGASARCETGCRRADIRCCRARSWFHTVR